MRRAVVSLSLLLLTFVLYAPNAGAVCSTNRTLIAGQMPDISFAVGSSATKVIVPYYATFNDAVANCGVFARIKSGTTVSVRRSYGCPGGAVSCEPSAISWRAVANAYGVPLAQVSTSLPIFLSYNGGGVPGPAGILEIAIASSDIPGPEDYSVIHRVPIFLTAQGVPHSSWFQATSTVANITGSAMVLEHPRLNGSPNMPVFVSHKFTGWPGWNHPIGVSYAGSRWRIENLDGAAMPAGLSFNVHFDPSAEKVCTPPNSGPYADYPVSTPGTIANPWATVFVSPISGSSSQQYPVGSYYRYPYWRIKHTNNAHIFQNSCFFVKAFGFSQYIGDPALGDLSGKSNTGMSNGVGIDMNGNGVNHSVNGCRCPVFNWSSSSEQMLIVTPTAGAGSRTPVFDPKFTGVVFSSNLRCLFHEDTTAVPTNTQYATWGPYNPAYPPY